MNDFLFDCAYYTAVICLSLYGLNHILAIVAALIVWANADPWTVDKSNPLGEESKKRVVRTVEPFEMMIIGKGGKPKFPIIQRSAMRVSLKGLQKAPFGMQNDTIEDWDTVIVPAEEPFHDTIQETLWWMSPLYVFRKLTHMMTGRHVVRVFFPFYVAGVYERRAPLNMKFVRARSKQANSTATNRTGFVVVDQGVEGSEVAMVQDYSDHVLYTAPIRYLIPSFPCRGSANSLRADVTVTVQVKNLHRLVAWADWSEQLLSVVADAVSAYIRPRTLDEAYVIQNQEQASVLQDLIAQRLREDNFRTIGGKSISVLDVLGLDLQKVTLNDLLPADTNTEKAIVALTTITTEGEKRGEAAAALLKAQAGALTGVPQEVIQALAQITAAQNLGKGASVQYIMGAGGGASVDQALLAQLAQHLKNLQASGANK